MNLYSQEIELMSDLWPVLSFASSKLVAVLPAEMTIYRHADLTLGLLHHADL